MRHKEGRKVGGREGREEKLQGPFLLSVFIVCVCVCACICVFAHPQAAHMSVKVRGQFVGRSQLSFYRVGPRD